MGSGGREVEGCPGVAMGSGGRETDVHIVAVEIIYSALSNNYTHSHTPMFDSVGPLKI